MTDSDQSGGAPGLPPTPPPLPPQTGPQPVPANADEALEIGRQHFPEVGSPGGPSGLFVHEFDIGYLIHASWPPAADPTAPPAEPGGSNVVIDKADGEVSFLPNFPPESAAKLYHRLRNR
ncbi:hypothetical protein Sgleb_51340 [Streptomyces glebosus]|uniref:Immunity protein 35 domain-containing protein n=1 Tax=Streptomyces glebosus TaxID=249580 RepID=A0A640T049_9ACTN|nr:hypothetical protein [Streptomyces glebosus]GFE17087.1 hypothetical protein Sgleb_51340 [Streptomyces glebosus]GHG53467.1 hypothetical protein GCM10010513_14280 [Streptomyces glebosus]